MTTPLPATIQRGDGDTTVLLLHGVGGGKEVWPWQLEAVAARGYRAVAWDMPGYGASAPVTPYTMGELAASLALLLRAQGARRVVLVGHSMGGMVAQELLAQAPKSVHGLVLSATTPAFGPADGAWQQQFLQSRLAPLDEGRTMRDLAAELVPAMVGTAPDTAGVRLATQMMGRVAPATYRAALHALVGFDRRDQLGAIRIPALLLAGERDATAPPRVMERMAGRIPGARYTCVEGAGHLLSMEQPGRFNDALIAFLAQYFPPESQ